MSETSKGMDVINDLDLEVAAIGVRLLDDAYLAWFTAESESDRAVRTWWQSSGPGAATAYATYTSALDREEAAARDLERFWGASEPCRTKIAVGVQAL